MEKNLHIAQNNIDFYIPVNLEDIPLEQIIQLRNQKDFAACRKAYSKEIEKQAKDVTMKYTVVGRQQQFQWKQSSLLR